MISPITNTEQANRFARAIVSDICMYNEEKIVRGFQQDRLFEEIKEEIQKGLELYQERVSKELLVTNPFFENALVDLIFQEKGEQVPSQIW
jgi:hypothetical protein